MDMKYDVVIIGGGAIGCACARELSRYRLRIAVLEKDVDVACGTSGRNSAVVHAGFNNRPGSLMARFCTEGNRNFQELCREIGVPYRRTGKLLVALDEQDQAALQDLYEQGRENGAVGLRLISGSEIGQYAPFVSGLSAMYSGNTGIFNPFLYTVALAENAHANGAEFFFGSELVQARRLNDGWELAVKKGDSDSECESLRARYVINCAGLYADEVAALFGIDSYRIYPCRGQYLILDRDIPLKIELPVYPVPRKGAGGLGIHVTPTTDGNVILGPSAEYIDERDDYESTGAVIDALLSEAGQLIPGIRRQDVIGQYTGIRPKQAPESVGGYYDFIIRAEDDAPGLINLIGIESPGLTASVPIGRYVAEIVGEMETLKENPEFRGERRGPVRMRELADEQKAELIRRDPEYGQLICRCEGVTRREVRDAIENPLGTVTIAGIKNRTRCMTGRCQGGVCLAKLTEILIKDYGYRPEEIRHRGRASYYYTGRVK